MADSIVELAGQIGLGVGGGSHLPAIIDALATPIAVFDAKRRLTQFNRAYSELWRLDPQSLSLGTDEVAILDRLHAEGRLPAGPDYQEWRDAHLSSYALNAPRESEPWYLPDGRTVQVIAAPAGPDGGVIYVFEDITEQLNMRGQRAALLELHRSTLNALPDGIIVFTPSGHVTLTNPQFAQLWKLQPSFFESQPTLEAIERAIFVAHPNDGASIWRDFMENARSLAEEGVDRSGRVSRLDGVVLEYAIVGLPDRQIMMAFRDVSGSASVTRFIHESNEALITAARLREDFATRLSYELRAPITNVIGFSELLEAQKHNLSPEQISQLGHIRESGLALAKIISGVEDSAGLVPEQRPGLSFAVADGIIDVRSSGGILEDEYQQLQGIKSVMLDTLSDMIFFSAGSNAFPNLSQIASDYKDALLVDPGMISIDRLYANGIRLANLQARIQRSIADGELPESSDSLAESIDSLLAMHGTFVLGTDRGRMLVAAARAYRESESDSQYKRDAVIFSNSISRLATVSETAKVLLGDVNRDIEAGPFPHRSTEVAKTANFNILATMGKVVIWGTATTIAAGAFTGSVPGSASIAAGSELFNSTWFFLLNNQFALRGLAGAAGQDLAWLVSLLNWMENQPSR